MLRKFLLYCLPLLFVLILPNQGIAYSDRQSAPLSPLPPPVIKPISDMVWVWPTDIQEQFRAFHIHFEDALDQDSVIRALRIIPTDQIEGTEDLSSELALEGELEWYESNLSVIFTAEKMLPAQSGYIIRFADLVRDLQDNELQIMGDLYYQTPPATINFGRLDQHHVDPNKKLKVAFDRPMNRKSVIRAFSIEPEIELDFEWDENTLYMRPPDGYFEEKTIYRLSLDATLLDLADQPLITQPIEWAVRMKEYERQAQFGYGTNTQVLDTDGRRAIQYQLFGPLPNDMLDIALFRLDLPQFLDQYTSGFRGVAGRGEAALEADETQLVKRWQSTVFYEDLSNVEGPVNNIREIIVDDDVPAGLYILEIGSGPATDQLLLILTHNVITLKSADDEIVAWVTDMNGDSLADMEVSVYARDSEVVAQGRTDENGLFRTTIDRDTQPLIVVAQDGDDMTATGLSNEWLSRNGHPWWNWWQPTPTSVEHAVHTYTDRPIYRPGQTIFYKSIIRNDDDAVLSLPSESISITVRIRDARNNVVQTTELPTNEFGTINGDFTIADGAMLGDYAVEIVLDEEVYRQIFKVEEYRKPDYEVSITTYGRALDGTDSALVPTQRFVDGDTVTVRVDVHYLMGEPVANAELNLYRYTLQAPHYWNEIDRDYVWYGGYEAQFDSEAPYGEALTATTNANGVYTFTQIASSSEYQVTSWFGNTYGNTTGIEISADDGSHQTVSGFAMLHTYNAAEQLALDTDGYVKKLDTPFEITIQALTLDGQPVANRNLSLRVIQSTWSAGQGSTESEVEQMELITDEQGYSQATLNLEQAGYYRLQITGADNRGNQLETSAGVYVLSEDSHWISRSQQEVAISADQAEYEIGDTARFLIESSFSGPALLSYERGTTRRAELIELTAPLTTLERVIQADDVPNIFVKINAWHELDTNIQENQWQNIPDSRLYTAQTELQVRPPNKRLTIELVPDRERYGPREEATFQIKVTDELGAPVVAELSLALVDEAIFLLSDELSGPIFDSFYAARDHLVRTYDGMALVREFRGGYGGGGGGDMWGNPRSDFPDTAVWIPVIQTDEQGEASLTLTLPDTLTSWRLTAKATTDQATQVGETFINIETQQPLVVRPILPSNLTAGDTVQLSALVHNYGTETVWGALLLEVDDEKLTLDEMPMKTVQVEPGMSAVVGWSAVAMKAGDLPLTISVVDLRQLGNENPGQDAVQLPLSIDPLSVPDITTDVGQLAVDTAYESELYLPADRLPESVAILELNRSIAGSLLTGLEYLTGFPYGCVEQTMSRALPNAVVGRALHQLGESDPSLQADLPAMVNAGLQRLYAFQHNDGGWGWWFDDSSDAYQTAWVLLGLSATAQAGYEVDPEVIARGTEWLSLPKSLDQLDASTKAFVLYSLALAGESLPEPTLDLANNADELDTFSQAALALTLQALGETEAMMDIFQRLVDTVQIKGGSANWSGANSDGHYDYKTMASDIRSTALALTAFVKISPGHDLEPAIVRWLMGQRTQRGWGTTNETAFAILGLTDHLLATQDGSSETAYAITLNGETLQEGTLGRGQPSLRLEIASEELADGLNNLKLEHVADEGSGGQLYYTVSSRTLLAESEIAPSGVVLVERTYLDPETDEPLTTVKAGQLVKVELGVDLPDRAFYMIIEDKLPGGLEALNERLNTTSRAGSQQQPVYYWQSYGYNHKEVREDRVSFFVTEMDARPQTFTYMARATHAGKFAALPAEAYAMYDLATWGRSGSSSVVVE